jgi:predicted DNA-binding transcriptional regulator AlpA
MTPQNLIGATEAARILGVHRATFWVRQKSGRYPEPVVTAGNHSLYDAGQIRAAAEKEKA